MNCNICGRPLHDQYQVTGTVEAAYAGAKHCFSCHINSQQTIILLKKAQTRMRIYVTLQVELPFAVQARPTDIDEWIRYSFSEIGSMQTANPLFRFVPDTVPGTLNWNFILTGKEDSCPTTPHANSGRNGLTKS